MKDFKTLGQPLLGENQPDERRERENAQGERMHIAWTHLYVWLFPAVQGISPGGHVTMHRNRSDRFFAIASFRGWALQLLHSCYSNMGVVVIRAAHCGTTRKICVAQCGTDIRL
jgi:hypothetical protein